MKTRIISILFCSISLLGCAQEISLKEEFKLPPELPEASGIVYDLNNFWIINDSGNEPKLYQIDLQGNLLDSIYIKAENRDWEDLTMDNLGNLYIADCGNNENKRLDLTIYKILQTKLTQDSIVPEKITFNYANQTSFPPVIDEKDFDCEAIIWNNNGLLLFTKNRSKSKFTRMYKLSDQPGNYSISPYDSIQTNGWITSASLSYNNQHLLLQSEDVIYVVNDFTESNPSGTSIDSITFSSSQKEAVTMDNNGKVYIAEEAEMGGDNFVYSFNLPKVLGQYSRPKNLAKINRTNDQLNISYPMTKAVSLTIYLANGQTFYKGRFTQNTTVSVPDNGLLIVEVNKEVIKVL